MSANFAQSRGGLLDRFLWDFSFKNRKILIPLLLIVLLIMAFIVIKNYLEMDMRLKHLSRFEPIYVVGVNKDLNIGDVISKNDLKPFLFYKNEYEKLTTKDDISNLEKHSLINCQLDSRSNALIGTDSIVGRVVNIPIYKNSFLRQEFLAPVGTLPGLVNLIEPGHTLADVTVAQTGFNVFIKPNDFVELASVDRAGNSKLIASKVKVILVDSLPLGKAPFHVNVDERAKRHLTLSLPETKLAELTQAVKNKTLVVTYKRTEAGHQKEEQMPIKKAISKPSNPFQALMMITGSKKELITE